MGDSRAMSLLPAFPSEAPGPFTLSHPHDVNHCHTTHRDSARKLEGDKTLLGVVGRAGAGCTALPAKLPVCKQRGHWADQ